MEGLLRDVVGNWIKYFSTKINVQSPIDSTEVITQLANDHSNNVCSDPTESKQGRHFFCTVFYTFMYSVCIDSTRPEPITDLEFHSGDSKIEI